ncbi:MAG: fibronectin type III domain-containing protein [Bacteroidetes bacterium]|nr:fibronectin type III domain-containing protein [Bacteroidota bacterium]
MTLGLFFGSARAQFGTGVLNPNDPVITYNSASPPATPPLGTLAKWVRTKRVSYNTDDFKCYYYNGVQFRLKWPTTWTSTNDGKTWPLYLFFHGVGEAGKIYDNEFQLSHGGNVHQAAVNNLKYDGFLLYPQSQNASGGWNQQQIDIIAQLLTQYIIPQCKVDINRISVDGLSGGGDATWEFAETHPTLAAGVIPLSAANISDINYVNILKYTPIWLFQGGLDKSPDPSTTIQLVNAYNNAGGNLKYTVYPTLGHNTWDKAWQEPDYFPFMMRVNTANPWVLTGKNQFCPGTTISATLGVVAGLDGYAWRKDGVVISGATSNTLQVSSVGTYDCQVKRGSTWSSWSPIPMVISLKQPTVPPTITTSGLETIVEPAPDGSTGATLMVPASYTSYVWKRVDVPATMPSTTNILTGATPGQYVVSVTEQFGCAAATSAPFTVIDANGPNAPGAPVNLLATTMGKTQIKVTWGEGGGYAETQFEIYQATKQDGPYSLIGFTPANVDSFVVSNLNPKTVYFYKVRAINATAGSPVTGPASSQTQADVTPPTAPGNLRTSSISQTTVTLLWNASTDDVGVNGYDIYVNGNLTASVNGGTTSFQVCNLVNAQTYTFAVKAKDVAGNVSPFSNQLVGVPSLTGVNYQYYIGTWTSLPDFNALNQASAGTLTNISLSPATQSRSYGFLFTGFINFPVAGNYTFRITSVDGAKLYIDVPYSTSATANVSNDGVHNSSTATGSQASYTAGAHSFALAYFKSSGGNNGSVVLQWRTPQSNNQFVTIPNSAYVQNAKVTGTPPQAPSGLVATTATAKKINLSWVDNSTTETGFQVFRSTTSGGTYVTIATVKPAVTSYGDSTLDPSTTYYYKVAAINQSGSSALTAAASATTQALPAVPADPSNLTGVSQGPTHAGLNWTNNASNATGFEIWRSPVNNSNYLLAATIATATSFVDSGLTKNTQYFYKVRAFNEGGVSNFSNEATLTTGNNAVTTVTLSNITNQSVVNDTTVLVNMSASSSSPGAAITYSATGLPSFVGLTDNHDGTGVLSIHPNSANLGSFNGVIVTATDAFGGSASDTFNITVSGRNSNTVQVSFNTNNYPVTAPGWNGMNVAGATNGASRSSLVDVNGVTTSEGVTITSNFDGAYATGMNTGNNSGIYPDNVLRNFYFGSTFNNYSFKVTGLSASKKYALVFFAGYPWTANDVATYGNMITNYTVGSQTVTLNVANNISNTVQISGISPDGTGAIAVTINKPLGSAYCLINDMQIISYDAPATPSSLIPPSKLVANGVSGSSIRLNWVNSSDARTGLQIWRTTNPNGTWNLLTTAAANATTYTDANLPANSTYFYEVREAVSGGQFSGYSNIAGGSTVQYTVNVSFNSQTTGAQPAPWNDFNTLITDGFSLNNLMDMKAQKTGINVNIVTAPTSFNDQLGVTTGNNSGIVPDAVMKTFYYNSQGDTAVVNITGLSKTGIFNFGFYAGTIFSNAPTVGVYQIGNQIVSLNAYNNTSNMVFINGVKPDSTGTVKIIFYTDVTTPYAMWTSLTIQGMPSPDVIAADSAGTAGTIATRRTNNGLQGGANGLLSTDSTVAGALAAYPNPFVDNVVVKFDIPQNVGRFTLAIVDAAGRIARKQEFKDVPAGAWQQTLNLSGLGKGIYFIRVYGLPGNQVKTFRLVKVQK